jgi:predicted permease
VRSVVRTPGLTLLIVAILALGTGTAVTVFCLVDALLFRELPVSHPEELVALFTTAERRSGDLGGISVPLYQVYKRDLRALVDLALYREDVPINLGIGQEPARRAWATVVSGNYFRLLGLRAKRGRLLEPADDTSDGARAVAVLSEACYRRRFAAGEDPLETPIRINGRPYQVVGVAPPGFDGLSLGSPDLFLTVSMGEEVDPILRSQRGFASFTAFYSVGRLAPGKSRAEAQAEAELVGERAGAGTLKSQAGDDWQIPWPYLVPARELTWPESRRLAWLLSATAALVLTIAAADAGGLWLARSDRRLRELAVRVALGAGRLELVRERVAEAFVLSIAAGTAGIAAAAALTRIVLSWQDPLSLPLEAATGVFSLRAFLVAAGLSLLVGTAASILPALTASSIDPMKLLRGDLGHSHRLPLRSALVALQVAVTLALLVATGLLLRSLEAASRLSFGPDASRLLVARLEPATAGYDAGRALRFERELREELARIPGVEAVAFGTGLPFEGGQGTSSMVDGRSERLDLESVGPDYLKTLGLPLLRGRDLAREDEDRSTGAALVSEGAARRLWPGSDPIGKVIGSISPRKLSVEVVGVVGAPAREPGEASDSLVFVPRARFYDAFPWQQRTALYVRAAVPDPRPLIPALSRAVQRLAPDLPVTVRTATEQIARPFSEQRLLATSFGALSTIALVLVSTGLFGVVTSATEARRREIGVRVCLGARPRDVILLVQGRTARLVGLGLVLGLPLAFGLARILSHFLFRVGADDPAAFLGALPLLAGTGLLAAYGPTRRALAIAPSEVMRSE